MSGLPAPEEFKLLRDLCAIPATSGDELPVRDFLLEYCRQNSSTWKNQPEIFAGDDFQDNLILVFGKPRTAFFAHMDTVGYTIRYDNYLIAIGGPDGQSGDELVFELDGKTETTRLIAANKKTPPLIDFPRPLEPGTTLTYKPAFRLDKDFMHSPYLDNRLGIFTLLQLAVEAQDIALVFTCWEEHGGGAAGYLARFLLEKYGTRQAVIADVTWSTEGVFPGMGCVVSLRDSRIPRKVFTHRIRRILSENKLPFQLEVEAHGGSDGTELQQIPYPIDWCFIGPPSENPHSARESVHLKDARNFLPLLKALAAQL